MIYGTPALAIDDDRTDRIGIRSLTLSLLWQPSRWPMSIEELDAEAPPPPAVSGGLWFVGRQTRRLGGALRTAWSFEGINGGGKDVTFKTRANSPDYGFEPGFAEAPIQRHPRIAALLDQFEGQVIDNEIIWPRTLSAGGGAGGGLGGAGAQEVVNPMFGRSDYLCFQGGTYWYRYALFDESGIPDIIGRIFNSGALPGRGPRVQGGRNWLGAGAPFKRRGPVLDVTELYYLSDEGGWPKPIYGRGNA